MALGGSAVKKAPVQLYGIPQENMGTSSQMGFGRKGGAVNTLPKAQLGAIVKTIAKVAKPVVKSKVVKPLSKELSVFQKQRVAIGKPVYRGSNPKGNMTMSEIKAKQALQNSVKKAPKKLTKEQQYLKDVEDSYRKNGGTTKSLPKAQLGTIVKAVAKFVKPVTKPVAKNIIKDIKVVARPINRSAKPVAKKLNPKVSEKFIVNKTHAKLYKENSKVDKSALKIATGIGAMAPVAGFVNASMNKAKANTKAKTKKK